MQQLNESKRGEKTEEDVQPKSKQVKAVRDADCGGLCLC